MAENTNLQPTYMRQRFLLSFIRQLKDNVSATDLQKLVFLNNMNTEQRYYEFIPYKYGAYSFQLAEDVEILCKSEFVSSEESKIRAIGKYLNEGEFQIATERGNNLLRKAYREHPYYAINSKILERLFSNEEAQIFNNEKTKYSNESRMLFTIGYEGKTIEEFVNVLIKSDIKLLCDVRKNPLSRKFGFSKNKLAHIVEGVGINYIHIPELGIESDKRASLDTKEDYFLLFKEYSKSLPSREEQLTQLHSLFLSKKRIALMCYEKEPEMCHRHVIRDYLLNSYEIRSEEL